MLSTERNFWSSNKKENTVTLKAKCKMGALPISQKLLLQWKVIIVIFPFTFFQFHFCSLLILYHVTQLNLFLFYFFSGSPPTSLLLFYCSLGYWPLSQISSESYLQLRSEVVVGIVQRQENQKWNGNYIMLRWCQCYKHCLVLLHISSFFEMPQTSVFLRNHMIKKSTGIKR